MHMSSRILSEEDNFSQRNCQNQFSHPGLSHKVQESQESFIQGRIHIQQNLNEGLEYTLKAKL